MTDDTVSNMDLSQWLAARPPRSDADAPLKTSGASRSVELSRPEQVAAVTVGLMMLERAAAAGGTRAPLFVVRDLRETITRPLTSRDVMTLEVEAYDTMCWFAGIEVRAEPDALPASPVHGDTIDYDPDMPVLDLLRRAIIEEFDVEIQYYTQSRGELTRRRISPHHVQAETYLHAYCQARLAERVFRISRIAEIRPVDGRPVSARKAEAPKRQQGELDF